MMGVEMEGGVIEREAFSLSPTPGLGGNHVIQESPITCAEDSSSGQSSQNVLRKLRYPTQVHLVKRGANYGERRSVW